MIRDVGDQIPRVIVAGVDGGHAARIAVPVVVVHQVAAAIRLEIRPGPAILNTIRRVRADIPARRGCARRRRRWGGCSKFDQKGSI